ncbi:cation/H(+) antiporter 4-like [Pistacia vera]|uniref:cation/H(+) antiporter 4-like n=1 Tax=Pistacia vera TaxID=55513 RepID=UPI0012639361|nr:cation/H(+) antiporter 4-like [Pistacia vera]
MNNFTSERRYPTESCLVLPPLISSAGLLTASDDQNYRWLDYASPRLQLIIVLIFVLTQGFHSVLKQLGLPIMTSQIIAGVLLSEAVLPKQWLDILMSEDSVQLIGTLGEFGYSVFVFLSGVKMDMSMVTRVGAKACYLAFISILVPMIYVVSSIVMLTNNRKELNSMMHIAPLFYITCFPVIHCLLTELKILNSELGRLAHSTAIIADFLSFICVIGISVALGIIQGFPKSFLPQLGITFFFIFIAMIVLRPIMLLIVKLTPEGRQVNQTYIYAIIVVFLISVRVIPRGCNKFYFIVIYVLGLAVPHGPPLGSALVEKFECMASCLFLPIFVTTCSMRLQKLTLDFRNEMVKELAIIAAMTLLVKFLSCLGPLLYTKMHKPDAIALALILSAKGVIELAAYTFMSDGKVLSPQVFNAGLIFVTFSASIVPVLVRKLYDPSRKYAGYQIRKIMDANLDEELHIVTCIHVPNNVTSVINMLNISCPTRETPLAVSVLHLIKLSGVAAPIFISHEKRSKRFTRYWYSENVILSFMKFEGNHFGTVKLNAFTAISSPEFMHDDICTLALDKLASLIILPFHRTWYIDGSLESEERTVRNLNLRVLEKAPCSVGILIDHGNIRRPIYLDAPIESYSEVAMLFFGGNDDREALTLAKRMARKTTVRLTVAQFVAKNDDGEVDWGTILDSEVMRDAKNNEYINYVKHVVNDGRETVNIVHSLVNEFDLIIVGRRYNIEDPQTSGLKEWSEFPEIGIMGDLLASKDLTGKCSVLVVQQQRTV